MVRRSNYSIENTPTRDKYGRVIKPLQKKRIFRTAGFLLPLLGTLLVMVLALALRGMGG